MTKVRHWLALAFIGAPFALVALVASSMFIAPERSHLVLMFGSLAPVALFVFSLRSAWRVFRIRRNERIRLDAREQYYARTPRR